jgi:hypothetical protein
MFVECRFHLVQYSERHSVPRHDGEKIIIPAVTENYRGIIPLFAIIIICIGIGDFVVASPGFFRDTDQ